MEATELFHKDGKSAAIFYCGKCRIVHKTAKKAEACCKNYLCSNCGEDTQGRLYLCCEKCRRVQDHQGELDRFKKAQKVNSNQWCGPIESINGEYYANVDEFLELADCDEESEYVWACDTMLVVDLNIDTVLKRCIDEDSVYEDFDFDDLCGYDELEIALNKFNDANKGLKSWHNNFKTAVILSRRNATKTT
jgi:hypothetical protein